MRLVYLSDDPIIMSDATANHVLSTCMAWKRKGGTVYLGCPRLEVDSLRELSTDVFEYGGGSALSRTRKLREWLTKLQRSSPLDAIYCRYRPIHSVLSIMPVFRLTPYFFELNGIYEREFRGSKNRRAMLSVFRGAIEPISFSKAAGIFTVSPSISEHYAKKYWLKREDFHIIPNGVWIGDIKYVDNRDTLTESTSGLKIVFVGNLAWWQDLDTAIQAMRQFSEIESTSLTIIGDGPEAPALKRAIASANLKSVHLVGPWDPATVMEHLHEFDVGLVSKRPLGMTLSPLKLWEYMAAGLPVIASEEAGGELVKELDAGFIYAGGDVDSLRRAILQCTARRDELHVMGTNGRRFVEQERSWEVLGRRTVEIILQSIDSGGS